MNEDNKLTKFSYIDDDEYKEKYKSDNWHKYESESDKHLTPESKLEYWKTKLFEYKKDNLRRSPNTTNPLIDGFAPNLMDIFKLEYQKPKSIFGIAFDRFCEQKIEFIEQKLNYVKFVNSEKPNNYKKKQPEFNPNHFNEKGFDLFLYLVDNYTAKEEKIIKYINIWYYLKYAVDKNIYTFNLTQDKYNELLIKEFDIKIKKFAIAGPDYLIQKAILNSLEQQFRGQKST